MCFLYRWLGYESPHHDTVEPQVRAAQVFLPGALSSEIEIHRFSMRCSAQKKLEEGGWDALKAALGP